MNSLRWAPLALLLIGQPTEAATIRDPRAALVAAAAEKAYVLEQMRLFVVSIQAIAEGLAKGDRQAVIEAAAARGLRRNANDPHFPASLGAKLPALWKQMGRGTRGGFDQLADAAKAGAPKEKSLAILAETMKNCVACHQTYRIVETAH